MFKVNVFTTIQDRQTKLLWLSFGVFEYKKSTCNVSKHDPEKFNCLPVFIIHTNEFT